MPRTPATADLHALLCERCGYPLAGLEHEPTCPECGRVLAESLPERRVGTPLQRAMFRQIPRAILNLHAHPSRVWSVLVPHTRRHPPFALAHCASAALLAGAALFQTFLADRIVNMPSPILVALAHILAAGALCCPVFMTLTEVEATGVALIARRRGWRVPHDLARAICHHASVVWWVAAIGLWAGLNLIDPLTNWLNRVTPASWQAVLPPLAALPPLAGFTFGMLAFESLVYSGVRACRFANRPPAAQSAPIAA